MTKKPRAKRLRKYRVLYAVTRSEYYEIDAATPKEAEDRAFEEGRFIDDSGETTNLVACDVEEIAS
jgi:hypothetical protein